jgi:hypothetical protein
MIPVGVFAVVINVSRAFSTTLQTVYKIVYTSLMNLGEQGKTIIEGIMI